MSEANKRQVGGEHYKKEGALQHWDFVAVFGLDYFQGQITKYVMRWRDKNGVQDLEKAHHFLEKYIELAKASPEIRNERHVFDVQVVTHAASDEPYQHVSTPHYTFEGAQKDVAYYTCRHCRSHFEVDVRHPPQRGHTCTGGEPTAHGYVDQG